MSLERLIELAKRTGDRLIVHDPVGGQDIVLLDVETYERLLGYDHLDDFSSEGIGMLDSSDFDEERQVSDSDWHSTASVLEENYSDHTATVTADFPDWVEDGDYVGSGRAETTVEDLTLSLGVDESSVDLHENEWEDGYDTEPELEPVPLAEENNPIIEPWQESPAVGDEPVFYEEPV